jgi:hypothetical protein
MVGLGGKGLDILAMVTTWDHPWEPAPLTWYRFVKWKCKRKRWKKKKKKKKGEEGKWKERGKVKVGRK